MTPWSSCLANTHSTFGGYLISRKIEKITSDSYSAH
jgi:hypothetical protein